MSDNSTPASNGMSIEDALNRIAELERSHRGILEDAKSERKKRQELEAQMERQQSPSSSGSNDVSNVDPRSLREVQRFASNPDAWFVEKARPLVEPMQKELAYRDAIEWLAEQEDKKPSQIRGSKLENELGRIAKEHNLGTMDVVSGTKAAYKLFQLEKESAKKAKEVAEKARDNAIADNSTEAPAIPQGDAPTGNKRIWKASEIPTGVEYEKHRLEILEAMSEGRVVQG